MGDNVAPSLPHGHHAATHVCVSSLIALPLVPSNA